MYRGKSRIPVYLIEKIKRGEGSLSARCRLKMYVSETALRAVSDAEVNRLARANIDLVAGRQITSTEQLESALACSPHEGLRIESNSGRSTLMRNGERFRLKVDAVSRTGSGKYCLDLSFGDPSLGCYRSYETVIPALVDDTVYVDAEVTRLRGRLSLRRIKVLDNLRSYFEPDIPAAATREDSCRSAQFTLRSVGEESALLELGGDSDFGRILLPVFNPKLLRLGKTLVGYDAREAEELMSDASLDGGTFVVLESAANGRRLKLQGIVLNGEYVLRTAVHRSEKLIFVYCAECFGNTASESR
jgi:hypothetical protein